MTISAMMYIILGTHLCHATVVAKDKVFQK